MQVQFIHQTRRSFNHAKAGLL